MLFLFLTLHTKYLEYMLWQWNISSNVVYVFRNLFWKICPLSGQILIKFLRCSRVSFLPSSYSEKKHWGRGLFSLTGQTWGEEFELADRFYSVSGIQEFFGYIIKKYDTFTNDPLFRSPLTKLKKELHLKSNQDIILSFYH